jgi:squalene synthase HpnC
VRFDDRPVSKHGFDATQRHAGATGVGRACAGPTIPGVNLNAALHAVEHYENFPVASWLVPARLRPAMLAIYRFARHADDIADEGDAEPQARLAALSSLRRDLDEAAAGRAATDPRVAALVPHVARHGLDWSRFAALLSAFEQDVTVHRYPDRAVLLDYCDRSAAPVGELVLGVFGALDPDNRALSRRICIALQLINFLQDMAIDWSRGRLYLPMDTLRRHGASETDLALAARTGSASPALRQAIADEAAHAGAMLLDGAPLAARVPMRLGWELRAILAGGGRILHLLERGGHDPFRRRPKLSRADALPLLGRMLGLAFAR